MGRCVKISFETCCIMLIWIREVFESTLGRLRKLHGMVYAHSVTIGFCFFSRIWLKRIFWALIANMVTAIFYLSVSRNNHTLHGIHTCLYCVLSSMSESNRRKKHWSTVYWYRFISADILVMSYSDRISKFVELLKSPIWEIVIRQQRSHLGTNAFKAC